MLTPTERQSIIDSIEEGTYDIDDALNDIATKQRGEDVRAAIFSGILLANDSGEGAVDPKARQLIALNKDALRKEISAIQKQMAEFIANNSGTVASTLLEETTLMGTAVSFTASNQSVYPTGATAVASIPLADEVTNYDYIEIEYAAAGRTNIRRFTPDQIRQTVHWSDTKFEDTNSYSGTTDTSGELPSIVIGDPYCELVIVSFRLNYSVADSLYAEANMWRWSGKNTTDGFIKSEITSSDGIRIFRIRGIKHTQVDTTVKDSELTDMRVGYDDTEYDSAGEAIRAQIQALWDAVNAIHIATVEVDQNGYLRFDGGTA